MLYDLFLPFVNNYKHLGNILQSDNLMTTDGNIKERSLFRRFILLTKNFILTMKMLF